MPFATQQKEIDGETRMEMITQASQLGLQLNNDHFDLMVRLNDPLNNQAQQELEQMATENPLLASFIQLSSSEMRRSEDGQYEINEERVSAITKTLDVISKGHYSERQIEKIFERNGLGVEGYYLVRDLIKPKGTVRFGEEEEEQQEFNLSHHLTVARIRQQFAVLVPGRAEQQREQTSDAYGEAVRDELAEAERANQEQQRRADNINEEINQEFGQLREELENQSEEFIKKLDKKKKG